MTMDREEFASLITTTVHRQVTGAGTATDYRKPLVGFASADDPRFPDLRRIVHPTHMLPQDLLPGARSVVSFFLPFAPWVVEANSRDRRQVAREWAVAYYETNALIGRISARLIEVLGKRGIGSAAEPATLNFDTQTLVSRWSHKSVGVIAGIGSPGLHHMVITDAGCAGRFGSLVLDAELPAAPAEPRERCLYFHDGSCLECVTRCPVGALDADQPIDKQLCWRWCQEVAAGFEDMDRPYICGKCAIGPCSFEPAVQ
ncbi:MAG: epoxyqueuosine reductase [Anaerolineae bacterium]|jgi:epoxyqueuosine reductase